MRVLKSESAEERTALQGALFSLSYWRYVRYGQKTNKMIIFLTTATVEAESQNMIFLAHESITAITGHTLPPAAPVRFSCE